MAKTTKAAGTLFGTKSGRKATAVATKTAGRAALKGAKAQTKLARRAVGPSQPTGMRLLKYGLFAVGLLIERTREGTYIAKTANAQARLARRAMGSSQPTGMRLLKYGAFALGGFAIGALVARSSGGSQGGGESASSADGDGGSQQGVQPESGVAVPPLQKPEDPNRVGADRSYSDPSAGPLIGRSHNPEAGDVPVQHEELENRIRTRIGEDPRTLGMQHLNVEVNDDVADIRGVAPSEAARDAVSEIAAETPGVREVRNLMTLVS